jgi:hypothetical protein
VTSLEACDKDKGCFLLVGNVAGLAGGMRLWGGERVVMFGAFLPGGKRTGDVGSFVTYIGDNGDIEVGDDDAYEDDMNDMRCDDDLDNFY